MYTFEEKNELQINSPGPGEKTLFVGIGGALKTKDENGLIEEISIADPTPVKVYKALLTQTGTNAPVATVLENTLGGEVIWSRYGVGSYRALLVGAFPENKVIVTCNVGGSSNMVDNFIIYTSSNPDQIDIVTTAQGVFQDIEFEDSPCSIIIEVYP